MRYIALFVALMGCSGTTFTGVIEGGATDAPSGDASAGDGSVNPLTITCGPQLVCTATQTCCVGQNGGSSPFACTDGTCSTQQSALKCAKTADCPMGNVCCAHLANDQTTSACMLACPTGPNDAQLCDTNAMPSGCATNVQCSTDNIDSWRLPQSFATCGGKKH